MPSEKPRELARQVAERHDRDENERHACRYEEPSVDGDQAVTVAGAQIGAEDADGGADDADTTDDQRQQQALGTERRLAEDQRRHERDRVGLEEVRRHTRAVTNIVADVVGNRGCVARIVLGDARLDLADQVGADVGCLGEDAAADTHEHGEQRATEAETLEHRGGVVVEDQQHDRCAEQAEADGEHADDAAGTERDPETARRLPDPSGRRDANVGLGGQRHSDIADGGRERGTDQEEQRPPELHDESTVVDRQRQQKQEDDDGEDSERAELPVQVSAGAFLHGFRDLLHARCPLICPADLLHQEICVPERRQRDHQGHGHQAVLGAGDSRGGYRFMLTGQRHPETP